MRVESTARFNTRVEDTSRLQTYINCPKLSSSNRKTIDCLWTQQRTRNVRLCAINDRFGNISLLNVVLRKQRGWGIARVEPGKRFQRVWVSISARHRSPHFLPFCRKWNLEPVSVCITTTRSRCRHRGPQVSRRWDVTDHRHSMITLFNTNSTV